MGFRQYKSGVNPVISVVYKMMARDLLIGEVRERIIEPSHLWSTP